MNICYSYVFPTVSKILSPLDFMPKNIGLNSFSQVVKQASCVKRRGINANVIYNIKYMVYFKYIYSRYVYTMYTYKSYIKTPS